MLDKKLCGHPGCRYVAVVRVQPVQKAAWDWFCHMHWIALALRTVMDAEEVGLLKDVEDGLSEIIDAERRGT